MNSIRRGLYDWLNGEYEKAASITNRIAVFRDLVGRTADDDMVQTVSVDGVVTGASIAIKANLSIAVAGVLNV